MHLSLEQIKHFIIAPNKKIFHKPGLRLSKRGRPAGGLIFIVDDDIMATATFPSNRIGILKINNLAIIQVYLPYHNPSAESNNATEFETEIVLLEEIICNLEENNYQIITSW